MNIQSKLTLGLGLIAVPLVLPAMSTEEAYLESYRQHPQYAEPVPTHVKVPIVSNEFAGQEITLEFVIDSKGSPTRITSITPHADPQLVATIAKAVGWWKFNPAYRDGKPVARRADLPVQIISQHPG